MLCNLTLEKGLANVNLFFVCQRNVFSMEQENQSYISSLRHIEDELMKLKVERQEKDHAVSILLKKYNRIQNFDRVVVC